VQRTAEPVDQREQDKGSKRHNWRSAFLRIVRRTVKSLVSCRWCMIMHRSGSRWPQKEGA